MNNLIGSIIDYESGLMDDDEIVAFFQEILESGLCWTLQGHYGRTAMALMEAGLIGRRDNDT